MADDLLVEKLFNFICSSGGYVELSVLLRRSSPLGSTKTATEARNWLNNQTEFVLVKDCYANVVGVRIDLKKKLCSQYFTRGFCRKKKGFCKRWHICKTFVEGNCDGFCGLSHDFRSGANGEMARELGLQKYSSEALKNIVAWSLPQVCESYLRNECKSGTCQYVHACSKVVQGSSCGCPLSHNLIDSHNMRILKVYNLVPPSGVVNVDFVRCSILILRGERCAIKLNSFNEEANDLTGKLASAPVSSILPKVGNVTTKTSTANNAVEPSERKVFDCVCKEYQCSVLFSDVRKRTDLFPREFGELEDWFRKKKGSFLITEDESGVILQVEAYSVKARICLGYNSSSRGDCKRENCFYLHVCREYITDSCISGATCSRNHHFQDAREKALLSKVKLDHFTDEQLRKLVLSSTPQVCSDYNHGFCQRGDSCNRIHVCSDHLKRSCSKGNGCSLDHDSAMHSLATRAILERYHLETLRDDSLKRIILVCNDSTKGKEFGHIRQDKPEEPICSDFLLGKCKKGSKCPRHHCALSFHWQYNRSGGWKSFNEEDNAKIEKHYCDENLEECTATDVQITFESDGFLSLGERYDVHILLDNMLVFVQKDFDTLATIRRLSTASYVTDPDNTMANQWTWYWKDEYETWRKYDQDQGGRDLQQSLEEAFLGGKCGFQFLIGDQNYKISFSSTSDMNQTNVKYGTTRKVRRRPAKFVSRDDIRELRRSRKTKSSHLPAHWSPLPSNSQYKRVPLTSLSGEFKEVEKLFRKSIKKSVKITSIERVQNPFMWEKYQRKKENMSASRKASANEKQLFHGTNPEIVDAICKQNFDWRLHGKNATKYGEGSYFALNSSYSDAYAKADTRSSKFMFVARVLVGSYATGQSSYRRPPQKDPSNPASDLYDSCVDNISSPTIFVVFDTDQCYPEYIIKYSIIQTAHGGHHGNYQQPSRQVRASSGGLGVSVRSSGSSATGAGSSGYASHSTSTPTRYQSYTSGASGGLYQNRASALSSTSGSSPYSSSASSTSRSRPSSNLPTRSTSQSGTSGYNSGSSANTGSLSTYSSPSSRSYSANPSSSSPPRSLSSPTRKAEVKKNSSRKPKCLIM